MAHKSITLPEFKRLMTKNWPEAARKINWFLQAIERAERIMQNSDASVTAPYQLTFADFEVLMALRMQGKPYELKPSDICRGLFFSSGGVTKILKRLEERAVVTRRINDNDSRSSFIRLSPKGLKLVKDVTERVLEKEEEMVSGLSTEEKKTLDHLLEKLLSSMESHRGV